MSYQIVLAEEAEQDIDAATAWMAQFSPEKATFWHFDIQEAIESLQNFPFRCPLAPESKPLEPLFAISFLASIVFCSR